eukprot:990038-Rhodomonas_salina.3
MSAPSPALRKHPDAGPGTQTQSEREQECTLRDRGCEACVAAVSFPWRRLVFGWSDGVVGSRLVAAELHKEHQAQAEREKRQVTTAPGPPLPAVRV